MNHDMTPKPRSHKILRIVVNTIIIQNLLIASSYELLIISIKICMNENAT